MTTATRTATTRYGSLDGLRGAAALVVVFYHLFEIARPYLISMSGSTPLTGVTPYSVFMTLPGSIFVAGPQAVYVFFVLSGLVLTLSVIRKASFDWIAYVPSRLIRLYLPAVASIVLSVVLILLVPRVPNAEPGGSWILRNALEISKVRLIREATLTDIAPQYNGVLWSLYLEVAFSVLLPAFVAFAVLTKRWWWAAGILALACAVAGTEADDYGFKLLPVFFLGSILAVKLSGLERLIARINAMKTKNLLWLSTLLLGLVLMIPAAFVPVLFTMPHGWTLIQLGWVIGAVLIVVACLGWRSLASVLEARVPAWFGKISFSLYLVHVPVLVTLAFLWGGKHWPLVGLIGIPLSIAVGWAFYVLVERPSHRLAQYVSHRVRDKDAGRIAETPQP
jgi:peptidoglycan/LPS O-acetylase OafA/YrhL